MIRLNKVLQLVFLCGALSWGQSTRVTADADCDNYCDYCFGWVEAHCINWNAAYCSCTNGYSCSPNQGAQCS